MVIDQRVVHRRTVECKLSGDCNPECHRDVPVQLGASKIVGMSYHAAKSYANARTTSVWSRTVIIFNTYRTFDECRVRKCAVVVSIHLLRGYNPDAERTLVSSSQPLHRTDVHCETHLSYHRTRTIESACESSLTEI